MADTSVDRFIVDAEAVLRAAYTVCRTMPPQFDSVEAPAAFQRLSVALGDAIRHLGPHAAKARAALEPDALDGGHVVDLPDGSRLTVDADGVVQHSVPDEVLRAMGLKPVALLAKDGGTLPLPPEDPGLVARLSRHERRRHGKGGDRSD